MLSRIRTGTDHGSLGGADIVIEAATENLELKLCVLKQLGETVAPHTVIASNTSSISITRSPPTSPLATDPLDPKPRKRAFGKAAARLRLLMAETYCSQPLLPAAIAATQSGAA
jgi:3-hydroxyacyl-CoA dehydrogenase, NAD binding domain